MITDRRKARDQNLKKYVGKRCSFGHSGIRYVSTGGCITCHKRARSKKVEVTPAIQVLEPYTDEQQKRLDTGALKYFGKPCRRGHDGLRYAKTAVCVQCAADHRPPLGLNKIERAAWRAETKARHEAALASVAALITAKEPWWAVERRRLTQISSEFDDLLG